MTEEWKGKASHKFLEERKHVECISKGYLAPSAVLTKGINFI